MDKWEKFWEIKIIPINYPKPGPIIMKFVKLGVKGLVGLRSPFG